MSHCPYIPLKMIFTSFEEKDWENVTNLGKITIKIEINITEMMKNSCQINKYHYFHYNFYYNLRTVPVFTHLNNENYY